MAARTPTTAKTQDTAKPADDASTFEDRSAAGTGEAKPAEGYTLVGAVAVPADLVAPNGVRVSTEGVGPALGVVSKDHTDDDGHILVVDPAKAGAPADVNKGVSEDEGGSNPPAFNADGLRPGEAVDFETISRVNREAEAKTRDDSAKAK
jgi:hypothetical protein